MRSSGVGKRYGDGPWVLSDVEVELSGGDVVAVTGGNGAGKSTLSGVLVGLTRPAVVGYVPDRFPPHDRMSARSCVGLVGRRAGARRRRCPAHPVRGTAEGLNG